MKSTIESRYLQQQLSRSIPSILADVTCGTSKKGPIILKREDLKSAYKAILEYPQIVPILKLASLAALKINDLAVEGKEKLGIYIGIDTDDVSDLTFGLVKNSNVTYFDGTVYLAGKNPELRLGLLINGLTRFAATEIYKNNAKPYNDTKEKNIFNHICLNLIAKITILPDQIKEIFLFSDKKRWHAELIAAVSQLIIMEQSQALQKICPDLYNYYKNVFLSDCKKQIGTIKDRNCISNQASEQFKSLISKNKEYEFELIKKENFLQIQLLKNNTKDAIRYFGKLKDSLEQDIQNEGIPNDSYTVNESDEQLILAIETTSEKSLQGICDIIQNAGMKQIQNMKSLFFSKENKEIKNFEENLKENDQDFQYF